MAKKKDELQELKEHLQGLKSQIGAIEGSLRGVASSKAHEAKQSFYRARDKAKEAIEDNPYKTAGIALGVGLVAGALLTHFIKR